MMRTGLTSTSANSLRTLGGILSRPRDVCMLGSSGGLEPDLLSQWEGLHSSGRSDKLQIHMLLRKTQGISFNMDNRIFSNYYLFI